MVAVNFHFLIFAFHFFIVSLQTYYQLLALIRNETKVTTFMVGAPTNSYQLRTEP